MSRGVFHNGLQGQLRYRGARQLFGTSVTDSRLSARTTIMPMSTLPPDPKNPPNPAHRRFAAAPVRCKGEHLRFLPIAPPLQALRLNAAGLFLCLSTFIQDDAKASECNPVWSHLLQKNNFAGVTLLGFLHVRV